MTARASWMHELRKSTSDSGTSTVRSSIASSSRSRSFLMALPGRDVDDLGAVAREPLEQVHVGRELELGQDDLPARTVVAEARRDDPHRHRDVLVHRDRAWRHAENRRQQIARGPPDLPPAFVPGPHASPAPGLGVLLQVRRGPARHGAERVAHEIGAVLDGRELVAPDRERVTGQRSGLSGCCCPDPRGRGIRRCGRRRGCRSRGSGRGVSSPT